MILELYLKSIHFNWDILLNTTEKFIGHCVQHNRKTYDLLQNSLWIILHNEKHSIVFVYLSWLYHTTIGGKFLKRWECQTILPVPEKPLCRSRSNRTGHGTNDWFKIGKGTWQGCLLSPCLFNLYAEYIMWNARQDESQAGIKSVRRNINSLKYADDTPLMAESEEELKSFLIGELKRGEKRKRELKSWLGTQH